MKAEFYVEGCKSLRLAGAFLLLPDQERALTELDESQGAFGISRWDENTANMRNRGRRVGEPELPPSQQKSGLASLCAGVLPPALIVNHEAKVRRR